MRVCMASWVVTMGAGAIGSGIVRRGRSPLVLAGMGGINNGAQPGLLVWLLTDMRTQIEVDPSAVGAVNVPFYRIALTMPGP